MTFYFRPATTRDLFILRLASVCICIAIGNLRLNQSFASEIDFNRDVRPILSDKCFHCHGPDSSTREADLRLDVEADAKRDLGGYFAIDSAHPSRSILIQRITSTDPSERMPPEESDESLSAAEIDKLRRWIADGAPWALAWSYVPPKRWPIPEQSGSDNWIDAFIMKRLNAEGLALSSEADRVTQIRRLCFDLTGIPPTPSEVDEFIADKRPDAYARLVDRLLDSPRFGERLAMYWLDLVRYADTTGYAGDQEHPISPYRDYVINAFNDNLPFDQFTREQIAGDLFESPTLNQTIATGYNRLLQTSHEGGVQIKEYLAIYAADRIRNLSAVWMGATVGCAQCHDHKFDPYTAKDFYALQAFFADVDEADHLQRGRDTSPTVRAPELAVYEPQDAAELLALQSRRDDLTSRNPVNKLSSQTNAGDSAAKGKAATPVQIPSRDAADTLAEINSRITVIQGRARRTMITVAIEPRTIRVLPRGNWQDESGQVVEPAIPEFLGKLNTNGRRGSRLDLANWLVNAETGAGGLTARVMANRFWYLMFGRGLAGNLDDFGGQGEPPDHPELLDTLAIEFVESSWDVKALLRQIALSRTYRQSSLDSESLRERDPLNRLFARQSTYRLPAEMVRDSVLALSGLLVEETGGTSIRPYQPANYYRHLNFPKREYISDVSQNQWRRGLYMHWQRQFLHPMLKAFDAPTREECTAQRTRSNTPLAALVLLNDPSFLEAARGLAERMLMEVEGDDADRIRFAFRAAVSRLPNDEELNVLLELLQSAKTAYESDPPAAELLLNVGSKRPSSGLVQVDLAANTIVARAIISMNESLSRN